MSEDAKWLLIVFILTIIIGYLTVSLEDFATYTPSEDVYIDKYAASMDSALNLNEEYVYIVTSKSYHMLYRVWKSPLYLEGTETGAYIGLKSVSCQDSNAIPYYSDARGKRALLAKGGADAEYWLKKAYHSEVGCIYVHGVPVGRHVVKLAYKLHPPLQCDQTYCLLELSLADEHILYQSFVITVEDPANSIAELDALGDSVSITKYSDRYVITGKSPENTALKLYILYKRQRVPAGAVVTPASFVEAHYRWLQLTQVGAREALMVVDKVLPFIIPLVFIPLVYFLWGREIEEPTVPEYLHYVPDERMKPWQVNLLFKGDATKLDFDAVSATILDLSLRGYLELRGVNESDLAIAIKRPDSRGLDGFERMVISLVKNLSVNGVFIPREVSRLVDGMSYTAKKRLYDMLTRIKNYKGAKRLAKKYITPPRVNIHFWTVGLFISSFIILTIYPFLADTYLYDPWGTYLAFIPWALAIQMAAVGWAPAQVFGRWKPGRYREKLQWDAFRRLLEDLVRLPQYQPQDLVVWKEWLVYGTALGVGDKVVEAMRINNIYVPEMLVPTVVAPTLISTYSTVAPKSSGGGGGVGGGGFGGGGAGAR